jgi:hypothetical protein
MFGQSSGLMDNHLLNVAIADGASGNNEDLSSSTFFGGVNSKPLRQFNDEYLMESYRVLFGLYSTIYFLDSPLQRLDRTNTWSTAGSFKNGSLPGKGLY